MNGFYLYKTYVSRGDAARRGTPEWSYGQLLTKAYYIVGVTALFDMLEQAELLGKYIDLVYSPHSDYAPPTPYGIKLVDIQPATSVTEMPFTGLFSFAPDAQHRLGLQDRVRYYTIPPDQRVLRLTIHWLTYFYERLKRRLSPNQLMASYLFGFEQPQLNKWRVEAPEKGQCPVDQLLTIGYSKKSLTPRQLLNSNAVALLNTADENQAANHDRR